MIPSLPTEILASILSHLEPSRPSDWHSWSSLAPLVQCCLVSKLFVEMTRPILYGTHYVNFDNLFDPIQFSPFTQKHALTLALHPRLAANVRTLAICASIVENAEFEFSSIPLAVVNILRVAPACSRLLLEIAVWDEHWKFLVPLVQVIVFQRPLLREFKYVSHDDPVPLPALAKLLRALPLLDSLRLDPIKLDTTEDPPQFHLNNLTLGKDLSDILSLSDTLPFLTAHSHTSLRHLSIKTSEARKYDLSRLVGLYTLEVGVYGMQSRAAPLGSLNAPLLHTMVVSYTGPKSVVPTRAFTYCKLLDKISPTISHVKLKSPVSIAYFSSFLAENAPKLRWQQLELTVEEKDRQLFKDTGRAYGFNINF